MFNQLVTAVLYQPLLNLLVFFYTTIPGKDIGLAIIALTLVIKVILYPLSRQAIVGQRAMQQLQPKLAALKAKYKDSKEKLAQETMALYKAEHINPLSSCLPLLIQLPLLLAVYQVFINGLNSVSFDLLYPFVTNPGTVSTFSLGIIDLAKPSWVLAVLAGAAQFWQAKMMPMARPAKGVTGSKDEDFAAMMNKQMLYLMPVMTVVIGVSLPAGLSLYWFIMTGLTALQQQIMMRKPKTEVVVSKP